ncbi:MAG TPA: LD-carboxypeptidase [Polyangia bacterium]|nr:LD-carboxypeptidase [Polyangia bacterium]
MIRPRALVPGDAVAVVAPAGPVPRDAFAAGARILGARYRLVHDERIFERAGFLAGSDDARAAELQRALADPQAAAIVCARGGYGLTRILARLDAAAFCRNPKWIVGFSDVTALHVWAARAGVESLHAPVVTQLGGLPPEDAAALFALLEGAPPAPLENLRALAPGRATGPLHGGNLELLSRLCGTPWQPRLDGAILLLEDVGERPYRVDRALTQLLLAGALDGLRGALVGEFHKCADPDNAPPSAEDVIAERLASLGIPILAGAPIGHGARNRAVPLGVPLTLDAATGTATFAPAAVY